MEIFNVLQTELICYERQFHVSNTHTYEKVKGHLIISSQLLFKKIPEGMLYLVGIFCSMILYVLCEALCCSTFPKE